MAGNFTDKVKNLMDNLSDWWNSLSTKKKWSLAGILVALIALVIGGIIWFHAPGPTAHRMERQQTRLLSHSAMHNKAKPKKYQLANGVPALSDLSKERRENPHPILRGQVSIPQYDVDVPIFEGTALSTLAWGGGTAKPYQVMGKGNYAVEAHNFIKVWDRNFATPNWFFSNFEKHVAAPGDVTKSNINPVPPKPGSKKPQVVIYSLDKSHVYKWVLIKDYIKDIRDPYAGHVLTNSMVKQVSSNHKTPLITMATCYEQRGILFPDQRIVLVGQLIKKQPRSQFKDLHKVFKNV